MSSFGALAHIRYVLTKRLGQKVKIGHAGTLDPLATGVLILCTGKMTKSIEELQRHTKEYVATLQLGATTASFDQEHPVDTLYPVDHITQSLVEQSLAAFRGDIEQVPPVFSAVKIDGKRAYKHGREQSEVEMKAKTVHVDELELMLFDVELKQMTLRVVCGKGTYIRSLARDIGQALGSGAYLTSLCRTRVGEHRLEDALTFDDFNDWLESEGVVSCS